MKDQFIPYHLALQLKQLGFNEKCIGAYFNPHITELKYPSAFQTNTFLMMGEDACATPLWQQAFDWFREEHNISGYIFPFKDHQADNNDPILYKTNQTGNLEFKTHNEAKEKLLQNLIYILELSNSKQS